MKRETLDGWLERAILGVGLLLFISLPLLFGGAPQRATGSAFDYILVEPWVVAEVLTLVLMALWLVRLWVDPKPRLLVPPICWAVLAFTVYALGRYWTAEIEYLARQEVLRVVVYAFLFLVVLNNLHRQESTQVIGVSLIVLAMLLSFVAVYQFLTESSRVWHLVTPYRQRGSGSFVSPNHLGGFLEMILPLALAYAMMAKFNVLAKIGLGYAALSILAGIIVTMSRGTWIATGLALVLFFTALAFHRPYRWHAVIALGLLIVAGIVVLPTSTSFKSRIRQMYSGGKLDDDARFALWRPAVQVWRQNPLWGSGPGHFDYRFKQFRPEQVQARAGRVHNDFLNTLADFGTVGAALVACAWAFLAMGAVKTWARVKKIPRDIGGTANSTKAAFVLGTIGGLAAILFHSAVDFNMHIPANAVLAVVWMALLSSHLRFATDNYWLSAGTGRKLLVSVLLLAGLAGIGVQAWQRGSENYWLTRAARVPQYDPAHVTFLQRAFAADPANFQTAFKIGEALRFRSMQGVDDYQELGEEAIKWYQRSFQLNPLDGSAPLMTGWCLDWLGKIDESPAFFDTAEKLDPNSYFTMAHIGLHFVEAGYLAASRAWFERSLRLQKEDNPIASTYLNLVTGRLLEAATNSPARAAQ